MAYSAALGEPTGATTTRRPRTVLLAHPMFPVLYEWPVSQADPPDSGAARSHAAAVHAEHDLVLHRLPREGGPARHARKHRRRAQAQARPLSSVSASRATMLPASR